MSIPVDVGPPPVPLSAEIARLDAQAEWLKNYLKRLERICLESQLELVRLERRTRDEQLVADKRHEATGLRLDAIRGAQILDEQSKNNLAHKMSAIESKVDKLLDLLQPKAVL